MPRRKQLYCLQGNGESQRCLQARNLHVKRECGTVEIPIPFFTFSKSFQENQELKKQFQGTATSSMGVLDSHGCRKVSERIDASACLKQVRLVDDPGIW